MSQQIDLHIEITVKDGDTSTERGSLLEKLAKRVLVARQYEHIHTNIRITGCELDVIAQDKQTGSKILVECKAYRDKTLPADVLTKLMGNLAFHDEYKAAWLITTSRLGKDAKGLLEQQRQKSSDKREQLRVWEADQLIELLVTTGQIVSAEKLVLSVPHLTLSTRTLCVTDIGEYWAVTVIGPKSGVPDSVLVFNAQDGTPVKDPAILSGLNSRDSNLKALKWLSGGEEFVATSTLVDNALRQELDSVAPVPVADDWSDYRPARPKDFVGRDDLLKNIVRYFDEVRTKNSATHLLAIKAPSGWGKSSFLVKLRAVCSQGRNKEKFFLYAVDCRTASSTRYPELALKKCFDEAIASGFVSNVSGPCRIASAGQPFADESTNELLSELKRRDKLVILFFDQFEEITTKQELADLFLQIKKLCSAVESAGENVVLGFSWKTDGSIPTDHPAYHVWHSFSDRRREFELPLFSKGDISKLLSSLSKELTVPIERGLRRLLAEHCQGYPWLLKKLCVHVFQVLQAKPAKQRDLLDRALDVEALFKKDLADLGHIEIACLECIATESPADHFKIADQYGDSTVDALLAKRLVVRNSGKLILYWDIFRDFVLSKQVPVIPARYIPVSTPQSAKLVIEACAKVTSIPLLCHQLSLQPGTVDNIARDLVMMGVCSYDRKKQKLKLIYRNQQDSLAALFKFFTSHALLRKAIESYGKGFKKIPESEVLNLWALEFSGGEYADKTISVFARRIGLWFYSLGLLAVDSSDFVSHRPEQLAPFDFSQFLAEGRSRRSRRLFFGEAPPARVLELIEKLVKPDYVVVPTDRNALYALTGLQLVASAKHPVLIERPRAGDEAYWLAEKVLAQITIQTAINLHARKFDVGGFEVGQEFARRFKLNVSEASLRRYGSGVLVWVNWLQDLKLVKFERHLF
jgi:Restriction endonuclease